MEGPSNHQSTDNPHLPVPSYLRCWALLDPFHHLEIDHHRDPGYSISVFFFMYWPSPFRHLTMQLHMLTTPINGLVGFDNLPGIEPPLSSLISVILSLRPFL